MTATEALRHRLSDEMVEEVSELFRALGDPARLRLVRALFGAGSPLNQGQLAEAIGASQANTSKHLGLLVRAGLLRRERRGKHVLFSVGTKLASDLCARVCGHVAQRAGRLHSVG